LDQTEVHRSAHKLFKLLGNQKVSGGVSGKIMKELISLTVNGNTKVNIIGKHVDSVLGIRIPLMKVKKHKFNKKFIEWSVMREMIEQEELQI
jgi:hypothetical protein